MTYHDLIQVIEAAANYDMGVIWPSWAGVNPVECVGLAIVCWLGGRGITAGRP